MNDAAEAVALANLGDDSIMTDDSRTIARALEGALLAKDLMRQLL